MGVFRKIPRLILYGQLRRLREKLADCVGTAPGRQRPSGGIPRIPRNIPENGVRRGPCSGTNHGLPPEVQVERIQPQRLEQSFD
jgi:hypothetical protein